MAVRAMVTALAPATALTMAMATAVAAAPAMKMASWSGCCHCRRPMYMNVRVSLRRTQVPRGLDLATFGGCWKCW